MKKIGIPINMNSAMCGVGASYFDYLTEIFNDFEVIFLSPKHDIKELDLLFLPGGADVNPVRYGGWPSKDTGFSNPYQEHFDTHYLPKYIERGVPVFGICRGHQTLNVHFGGSLKEVSHKTNPSDNPGGAMHKIYLNSRLPLTNPVINNLVKNNKTTQCNSRHHQGLDTNGLAEGFSAIFYDTKNPNRFSCIEAMAHNTLPIVSVQWHPEDYLDEFSMNCIEHLVYNQTSILNAKKKKTDSVSSTTKDKELQLQGPAS